MPERPDRCRDGADCSELRGLRVLVRERVHRLLEKFRASGSRLGRGRNRKENEGDGVEGRAGFSVRSISAAGLKEDFEKKAQSPPGRAASPAALPTSHFL